MNFLLSLWLLFCCCCNLDLKCPLKALFPTQQSRGGACWKRLDNKGLDLIKGLFHRLKATETLEGMAYLKEVNHWRISVNQQKSPSSVSH